MPMSMEVYFIRHGRTTANDADLLQTYTDSLLTEKGREQIYKIAEWISSKHIDVILSSSAGRCKETATLLKDILCVPLKIYDKLRERSISHQYEGRSFEDLSATRQAEGHRFVDPTQDWEGVPEVESDLKVYKRVVSVFDKFDGKKIACVTHAGVIKAFLHTAFCIRKNRTSCFKVRNGSVVFLKRDAGIQFQLHEFRLFH